MAQKSTPAISASLYRRFAAVTICATVLLGIFADGENREFHEAQSAASRPTPKQSPEPEPEIRSGFVVADDFAGSSGGGSFGSERDFGYGRPTVRLSGGSRGSIKVAQVGSGENGRVVAPGSYGIAGMSEEELARLSDAERAALEQLLANDGAPGSVAQRKAQASSLRQASLARSGATSSDDF